MSNARSDQRDSPEHDKAPESRTTILLIVVILLALGSSATLMYMVIVNLTAWLLQFGLLALALGLAVALIVGRTQGLTRAIDAEQQSLGPEVLFFALMIFLWLTTTLSLVGAWFAPLADVLIAFRYALGLSLLIIGAGVGFVFVSAFACGLSWAHYRANRQEIARTFPESNQETWEDNDTASRSTLP